MVASNGTASVDITPVARPWEGRAGLDALLESVAANVDDKANRPRGMGIGQGLPPARRFGLRDLRFCT